MIKNGLEFALSWLVNVADQATTFSITDTKCYVLVAALSTKENTKQLEQWKSGFKLLEQWKSGFKRAINWNKYQSKQYQQKNQINIYIT